jgi:hypothetical protein
MYTHQAQSPAVEAAFLPNGFQEPCGGHILEGESLRPLLMGSAAFHAPPDLGPGIEEDMALTHLLKQVDKSKKRTIWLVNNCLRMDHLQKILHAASSCSRVINLLCHDQPDFQALHNTRAVEAVIADERLYTVTMDTPKVQAQLVSQLIDTENFVSWKPVLGPSLEPQAVDHLRHVYRELTTFLNQKAVGRMTRVSSSHLFLANALVNSVFANPLNSLTEYKDLYKNKPVLIVATGPSLNKQLPLLEKYKDLFVIIAADPAVPILKKHGVVPQFVVSIDPQKRPYWKHNELDPATTFVIEVGCCPDVAWSSNHKYLVTSCHKDVFRLLTDLGAAPSYLLTGGSVTTTAFSLAQHMGANPIILIGQDLAWTDGKDHADGYVSQYSREQLQARHAKGFEIEGYDGKPVRTERQLLYYKTWFEQRIALMPDRLIVNATEGGARIEGAAHVPFESVCQEIQASHLGETQPDPARPWTPDFIYLAQLADRLRGLNSEIEQLESELNKGVKLIDGIKKKPKKTVIRQIEQINRLLVDGSWQVKTVVEMMAQSAVVATEQKVLLDDEVSANIKGVYGGYKSVYKSALQGVGGGKDLLGNLVRLLDEVLASEKLDLQLLHDYGFNRWKKDEAKNLSNKLVANV